MLQISDSLQTLSSLIHTNEEHNQFNEKLSSIMGECNVNNLESCITEQPWTIYHLQIYCSTFLDDLYSRLLYLTPSVRNLVLFWSLFPLEIMYLKKIHLKSLLIRTKFNQKKCSFFRLQLASNLKKKIHKKLYQKTFMKWFRWRNHKSYRIKLRMKENFLNWEWNKEIVYLNCFNADLCIAS